MKKCFFILFLSSSFIFLHSCEDNLETINEDVLKIIVEFVSKNDFSGYLKFEDNRFDTIVTCLSATLFDIDTNHYMVLIISRYPGDAFIGTPYYYLNQSSPMYYKLGDKDLFVYSHTIDSKNTPFPQSEYSEKVVLEKEKAYFTNVYIDDRFVMQTYKYHLCDKKVWIEKDSIFNLFQWLYP